MNLIKPLTCVILILLSLFLLQMTTANCKRIFTDKMTGKCFDCPQFLKMLDMLRPEAILVVWRLDRLGWSLKELIETVNMLGSRHVELRSLKENIDTTTSTGRLMFHVIAALAEFERDFRQDRTDRPVALTVYYYREQYGEK